jgi:hypothetical protein
LYPCVERPVDLHDLVAGLDARPLRRRIRQRGDHRDPAVPHVDLDAQAAVVARRLLGERAEVVGLEELGVRVLQLAQQPVDRHLVELALVERVHVVVGDVRQDLVEQAGLLVHGAGGRLAALQQPAPRRQRDRRQPGYHQDPLSSHAMPLDERAVTAASSRHAAS